MRFALQRQADALYAGGDEANNHSQLDYISLVITASPPFEYHSSGRRANSQQCWRPRTVPPWLLLRGSVWCRCVELVLPVLRAHSVSVLDGCVYRCLGVEGVEVGVGGVFGVSGCFKRHAAVSVGGTGTPGLPSRRQGSAVW
jgi:hypothetical protein